MQSSPVIKTVADLIRVLSDLDPTLPIVYDWSHHSSTIADYRQGISFQIVDLISYREYQTVSAELAAHDTGILFSE